MNSHDISTRSSTSRDQGSGQQRRVRLADFSMEEEDINISCRQRLRNTFQKWYPRIIVIILLAGSWAIQHFYLNNYYPVREDNFYNEILFTVPWVMSAICFVRACLTDPGKVPFNPAYADAELPESMECRTCDNIKPARAHHCQALDRCVLKMDHYCPWIGNCVGFANYKYYFLLLMYVAFGGWLFIARALCFFWLQRKQSNAALQLSLGGQILLGIPTALITLVVLSVTYLGLYHLVLIYNNVTTIEHMNVDYYLNYPFFSFACNALCKTTVCRKILCQKRRKSLSERVNRFDMGYLANMQQVLGQRVWQWGLPIQGGTMKGQGMFFPVIPEFTVHDMNQRYETVRGQLNKINGSYSVMDIHNKSEAELSRYIDEYIESARHKYASTTLLFGEQEFNLNNQSKQSEPILGDLYREQQEEQERREQQQQVLFDPSPIPSAKTSNNSLASDLIPDEPNSNGSMEVADKQEVSLDSNGGGKDEEGPAEEASGPEEQPQ